MSEEPASALEMKARDLFNESVGNVDMRVRSRLNQARQAALAKSRPHRSFFRMPLAMSAGGVCAAALLGVALMIGMPIGHQGTVAGDTTASFEDLDIVASTEESAGENLEMLQDDADFYEWAADKGNGADANGVG